MLALLWAVAAHAAVAAPQLSLSEGSVRSVARPHAVTAHLAVYADTRAAPEVPPHLVCISYLSVLYFAAYLANILWRALLRCWTGSSKPSDTKLAKAVYTLVHVPALCTLFLAARMWTLHHDAHLHRGMLSALTYAMYCMSLAILAEYLTCVAAREEKGLVESVVVGLSRSVVLLGAVGVLVAIFTSPQTSDAVMAVAALMAGYFGVHTQIAAAAALNSWFRTGVEQGDDDERRAKVSHVKETLALYPMLCVLLLSLRMRALELGVEAAATAIHLLVGAALTQVVAVLLQERHTSSCAAVCLSVAETAAMVVTYACCGVLVVRLLMLEEDPHAYAVDLTFVQAIAQADPVPTSLKCVTLLSVVFFAVYLSVLLARAMQYCSSKLLQRPAYTTKKVEQVLKQAEDAVLFVPMLSVLMIALRLRATTFYDEDPPRWAQVGMWVCVITLLVEVLMAPLVEATQEVFKEDAGHGDAYKMLGISCLVLRYLVRTVFYGGVVTLVLAVWAH